MPFPFSFLISQGTQFSFNVCIDLSTHLSAKILAPPSGVTWCFAHNGCRVGARVVLGEAPVTYTGFQLPRLDTFLQSCPVDWELADLELVMVPFHFAPLRGLASWCLYYLHIVLERLLKLCIKEPKRFQRGILGVPTGSKARQAELTGIHFPLPTLLSPPFCKLFNTVSLLHFVFYRFCVKLQRKSLCC